MVAYTPPDKVILTVGGSFRTEPLLAAADRLLALLRAEQAALLPLLAGGDALKELTQLVNEVRGIWNDPRAKKNDTPLQMKEVAELMAQARAWMRTLRAVALVNLALDTPALSRAASNAPELDYGYARDVLAELELRVEAARDLKPRLEEVGLSDAFLGRGRGLVRQLKTAIGAEDLDAGNLHFTLRRLYMRKGALYLALKRLAAAGRLLHLEAPERARLFHLCEIEPVLLEPLRAAKK